MYNSTDNEKRRLYLRLTAAALLILILGTVPSQNIVPEPVIIKTDIEPVDSNVYDESGKIVDGSITYEIPIDEGQKYRSYITYEFSGGYASDYRMIYAFTNSVDAKAFYDIYYGDSIMGELNIDRMTVTATFKISGDEERIDSEHIRQYCESLGYTVK